MITKNDYFKMLQSNPEYVEIMKRFSNEAEREKIKNTVESFASTFFDALSTVVSTISSNPEIENQITEALKTGDGIIKESDGSPLQADQKTKE